MLCCSVLHCNSMLYDSMLYYIMLYYIILYCHIIVSLRYIRQHQSASRGGSKPARCKIVHQFTKRLALGLGAPIPSVTPIFPESTIWNPNKRSHWLYQSARRLLVVRPISLLRSSLLRLLDSNFPGNSLLT